MAKRNKNKIDEIAQNYVENLIADSKFRQRIEDIRMIHSIPSKGYGIAEFDKLIVSGKSPRIPNKMAGKAKYIRGMNSLLRKIGLSRAWFDFMSDLVLFDFIGNTNVKGQIIFLHLGLRQNYRAEQFTKLDESVELNPVALLLPPSASQRDVRDYLRNNWEDIEIIQRRYVRNKGFNLVNAKRKNSRIKRRNEFILKHRSMPKRELMRKVHENFGDTLDYTYLNKIIAAELRKRSVYR